MSAKIWQRPNDGTTAFGNMRASTQYIIERVQEDTGEKLFTKAEVDRIRTEAQVCDQSSCRDEHLWRNAIMEAQMEQREADRELVKDIPAAEYRIRHSPLASAYAQSMLEHAIGERILTAIDAHMNNLAAGVITDPRLDRVKDEAGTRAAEWWEHHVNAAHKRIFELEALVVELEAKLKQAGE